MVLFTSPCNSSAENRVLHSEAIHHDTRLIVHRFNQRADTKHLLEIGYGESCASPEWLSPFALRRQLHCFVFPSSFPGGHGYGAQRSLRQRLPSDCCRYDRCELRKLGVCLVKHSSWCTSHRLSCLCLKLSPELACSSIARLVISGSACFLTHPPVPACWADSFTPSRPAWHGFTSANFVAHSFACGCVFAVVVLSAP